MSAMLRLGVWFAALTLLAVAPTAGRADAGASQVVVTQATIADIQRLLNALGYDAGPADGKLHRSTRSAIAQYQARNDLTVTGQPSDALRQRLANEAGGAERPPEPIGGATAAVRPALWQGVIPAAALVKSHPASSARSVRSLPAGTLVDVLERQGGWLLVRVSASQTDSGWVRLTSVRKQSSGQAPAAPKEQGGWFSNLARRVTRMLRSGGSQPTGSSQTVTVGVRGLSPQDLATASPSPERLHQLESYRADRGLTRRHAQQVALQARSVDYLSERDESASSGGGTAPTSSGRDD